MKKALAGPVLLFLLTLSGAAQVATGTITFKEGPLRLIRGTAVYQGLEGVRLRSGDILETGDKGLAQVEFSGGLVIALSNSARLMVARDGEFALPGGWMKAETAPAGPSCRFVGGLLSVSTMKGSTIVFHSGSDVSELFFESGGGRVSPAAGQEGGGAAVAKPGQFFTRHAGKKTAFAARPEAGFVNAMPVSFRDTLPSRLAKFAKAVEPKPDHEVAYADVEAWLRLPAWRKSFVERFKPRLKDAAFRSQIEAHLNEHPEWDEALHPEKYESKTPAADQPNPTDQRR